MTRQHGRRGHQAAPGGGALGGNGVVQVHGGGARLRHQCRQPAWYVRMLLLCRALLCFLRSDCSAVSFDGSKFQS